MDAVICNNKEEAYKVIDNVHDEYIKDLEFLEDGKIKIYLKDGWKNE